MLISNKFQSEIIKGIDMVIVEILQKNCKSCGMVKAQKVCILKPMHEDNLLNILELGFPKIANRNLVLTSE